MKVTQSGDSPGFTCLLFHAGKATDVGGPVSEIFGSAWPPFQHHATQSQEVIVSHFLLGAVLVSAPSICEGRGEGLEMSDGEGFTAQLRNVCVGLSSEKDDSCLSSFS